MHFGDHEYNLLLAVCIGEWRTALDHIETTEQLMSPFVWPQVDRAKRDLRNLLNQWAVIARMSPSNEEALVADARAYATEHAAEIDSLLAQKGVS